MANQLTRYATVATVDMAREGGFLGGILYPNSSSAATETLNNANDVHVYQFVLPFRAVVRNITFNVFTLEAGKFAGFGLYDVDGNRLVHTGAVSVAGTGDKSTAVTAVTIEPGVYFLAWTADGTTFAYTTQLNISTGIMADMWNQNATRIGVAANASSAGVLPATLGTITAQVTVVLPIVFFEP